VIAALALATLGFTSATAHRIDDIVASEVRAHRTPGIAVGVVESGRLVYARGFGTASRSSNIPVGPGTQFGIGQVSEQFTAAAVLLLAQSGRISLDDRVTKYLPQLRVARYVTIRELLDHTSGLPIITDWTHAFTAANAGRSTGVPGAAYVDNPLDYIVAGRIVASIVNEPLSDYVQQSIFVPLVMDASLYEGDTGLSASRAIGYTLDDGHFLPTRSWTAARLDGDAGVVSDVYDLAKWDIEFPILLRVDAVRDMFTPGTANAFERHGMGWTLDERNGHNMMWQNGEIPGFHAMNALLPDQHVAVIVLTNSDSFEEPAVVPESIAGRILDVVAPPTHRHLDNSIVTRARLFLAQLAKDRIDRTQLTPAFSRYLSDDLVRRLNVAGLGRLRSLVPISSVAERNGDTTYEFSTLFARGERHYRVTLTPDGKIDFVVLMP
jgi:D-alanyl-D-alanine carboxypeptidase